jgi:hypothetical protein
MLHHLSESGPVGYSVSLHGCGGVLRAVEGCRGLLSATSFCSAVGPLHIFVAFGCLKYCVLGRLWSAIVLDCHRIVTGVGSQMMRGSALADPDQITVA